MDQPLLFASPKGPCTQIYTSTPKYLHREYFKAKVYTSWICLEDLELVEVAWWGRRGGGGGARLKELSWSVKTKTLNIGAWGTLYDSYNNKEHQNSTGGYLAPYFATLHL